VVRVSNAIRMSVGPPVECRPALLDPPLTRDSGWQPKPQLLAWPFREEVWKRDVGMLRLVSLRQT
jgi:hypothetical protein